MSNNVGPIEVLDTIQGSSYLVIQRALHVLEGQKLDLNQYRITVVRWGESDAVIFTADEMKGDTIRDHGVRLDTEEILKPEEMNGIKSNLDRVTTVDALRGINHSAIQVAVDVFNQHDLNITRYKIVVVSEGTSKVILFNDKDLQPGSRGGGRVPGFEVELNAHDLSVLRSNFVR